MTYFQGTVRASPLAECGIAGSPQDSVTNSKDNLQSNIICIPLNHQEYKLIKPYD